MEPVGEGFRVACGRAAALRRRRHAALPGVPTDLQPMAIALAAVSDGTAMITENVFEGRFHVRQRDGPARRRRCAPTGTTPWSAASSGSPARRCRATDIRAGAGLVLAGLVADGVTEVREVHHIDRGYPRFVEQLAASARTVERVSAPTRWPIGAPARGQYIAVTRRTAQEARSATGARPASVGEDQQVHGARLRGGRPSRGLPAGQDARPAPRRLSRGRHRRGRLEQAHVAVVAAERGRVGRRCRTPSACTPSSTGCTTADPPRRARRRSPAWCPSRPHRDRPVNAHGQESTGPAPMPPANLRRVTTAARRCTMRCRTLPRRSATGRG